MTAKAARGTRQDVISIRTMTHCGAGWELYSLT